MDFRTKVVKFWKSNTVAIAGVGLIIAIHWMWYRIQQVKEFVPENQRKEFPLVTIGRAIKNKAIESFTDLTENKTKEEAEKPQIK